MASTRTDALTRDAAIVAYHGALIGARIQLADRDEFPRVALIPTAATQGAGTDTRAGGHARPSRSELAYELA